MAVALVASSRPRPTTPRRTRCRAHAAASHACSRWPEHADHPGRNQVHADRSDQPHHAFPGFTFSTTPKPLTEPRHRCTAAISRGAATRLKHRHLPGRAAPTQCSRPDATKAGQADAAATREASITVEWASRSVLRFRPRRPRHRCDRVRGVGLYNTGRAGHSQARSPGNAGPSRTDWQLQAARGQAFSCTSRRRGGSSRSTSPRCESRRSVPSASSASAVRFSTQSPSLA